LRVVDILSEGPAPQTGSELLRFPGVISLDSQDTVVFYMETDGASSTAVEGRCGANDFNIALRQADICIAHFLLPVI
jgi:hypothetical protein